MVFFYIIKTEYLEYFSMCNIILVKSCLVSALICVFFYLKMHLLSGFTMNLYETTILLTDLLILQVRTERLMGEVICGGICGDGGLCALRDQISWSLCILLMSSYLMWFSETHLSGTFTLSIAGEKRNLYLVLLFFFLSLKFKGVLF